MCAGILESSTAITASSSFPTPMRVSRARNRSMSIACVSRRATFGAPRRRRATASMSISGTIISTPPDMTPDLDRLPQLPRDKEGPVFAEAWQAQAFAMTIELSRRGTFTWSEWASALAEENQLAQQRGDPDPGDTYYDNWLAALEKVVAAKGLLALSDLLRRKAEWAHAVEHTDFGKPIELHAHDHD